MSKLTDFFKKRNLIYSHYKRLLCFLGPKFPVAVDKWQFKRLTGKTLHLNPPVTFSEKIQWLKLFDYSNNPLVIQCADKYRVREYLERQGCGQILNELYGVYRNADEIPWDTLPEQFVIKLNTASGYNFICRDKASLNIDDAKKKIRGWFRAQHGEQFSELHYTKIKPLLVCERYIPTLDTVFPIDYKIFCFHGKALFTMLFLERDTGLKRIAVDKNYNIIPGLLDKKYEADHLPERPPLFSEMIGYAEKLSQPFPFVRMDFYSDNGKVLFGEMTFTPGGGFNNYFTDDVNLKLGGEIHLPCDKKNPNAERC